MNWNDRPKKIGIKLRPWISVHQALALLDFQCNETYFYRLLREKKIQSIKLPGSGGRLVRVASFKAWKKTYTPNMPGRKLGSKNKTKKKVKK